MGKQKKKQKKRGNPLWTLVFLAALAVFCFSGYKLIGIYLDYKTGTDEYRDLQQYTTEITKTPETPAPRKQRSRRRNPNRRSLPNRSRNHCRIRQNRRLPSILNP